VKRYSVAGSPDEAVRKLLQFLFEKGRIEGAFVLTEISPGRYAYGLITDVKLLDKAAPTIPVMPANAGKMVSRLTVLEPVSVPVAVVLRPCELRALFELVKLEQARLENLLLVSFSCGGVLPTREAWQGLDTKLERYREVVKAGEVWDELRDTCRVCGDFIPQGADITLELIGSKDWGSTMMAVESEKGVQFIDGLAEPVDGEPDSEVVDELKTARAGQEPDVFGQFEPGDFGMDGLVSVFGRCINCHACGKVCPVCYCKSCHFEARESDFNPMALDTELNQRGGMRLPVGTVYYQVGRMLHVSMSCVGCGMCSDACPADIPVAALFTRLAGKVQGIFDYVAGRDVEEKIPTTTFETDELTETGE
jgi:formate dehydrogenase subunit beta